MLRRLRNLLNNDMIRVGIMIFIKKLSASHAANNGRINQSVHVLFWKEFHGHRFFNIRLLLVKFVYLLQQISPFDVLH